MKIIAYVILIIMRYIFEFFYKKLFTVAKKITVSNIKCRKEGYFYSIIVS